MGKININRKVMSMLDTGCFPLIIMCIYSHNYLDRNWHLIMILRLLVKRQLTDLYLITY